MKNFYDHVFSYDEWIYKPAKLNQYLFAQKDECITKLSDHSPRSTSLSIFFMKKRNQVFEIQKRENINTMHPLFTSMISNQMNVFDLEEQIKNIENYLDDWQIEKSNIQSIHFSKNKTKYNLTIEHACDWNKIDENHLKYYHFLLEIENRNTEFLKAIKNVNLTISKKKDRMNWFQKLKFELNQNIYDALKLNNLDIQNCKLEIKDQYQKRDYLIALIVNLENLLEKLDQRYKLCLEDDFETSSIWMGENLIKNQRKIASIEAKLTPAPISASLKQIIYSTLSDYVVNSSKNNLTHKRQNFMVSFIHHLDKFLQEANHPNSITEKSLIEFLIEMNFNHFQFLNWLSDHFFKEADKIKDPTEKTRYYLSQFLLFSNLPIRIRSMYNESEIALKDQLKKIVQYEMKYSHFEIIAKTETKKTEPNKSKIKLKTNASVLIQLLRSMNENGFFYETSPTRLAELITDNFNTNAKDQLTLDGIRNKYYNKEENTKKELIILLQNVIASLRKD